MPPLSYSSRNHCNRCLYSLHLDIEPGDRANECGGMLEPVSVVLQGKKGYVITFRCKRCGAVIRNKSAADDDVEKLIELMVAKI